MVIKKGSNGKTPYSTCMQIKMPQSLLVFAVSFTTEMPNFGTFGGVAPEEFLKIIFAFQVCIYIQIWEI